MGRDGNHLGFVLFYLKKEKGDVTEKRGCDDEGTYPPWSMDPGPVFTPRNVFGSSSPNRYRLQCTWAYSHLFYQLTMFSHTSLYITFFFLFFVVFILFSLSLSPKLASWLLCGWSGCLGRSFARSLATIQFYVRSWSVWTRRAWSSFFPSCPAPASDDPVSYTHLTLPTTPYV